MMWRVSKGILAGLAAAIVSSSAFARALPPSPYPQPLPLELCKLAPVDTSHLFVTAGVGAGDTLTNLQLDDPNSYNTMVRIKVAAGSQPLTVFLSSQTPVIWQFEGAVERVHRAIIASELRNLRVGASGLAAERVEFPESIRCPRAFFLPNVSSDQRAKNLETIFGRVPDRVVFKAKPNALTLPQGEFTVIPENGPRGLVIVRKDHDGKNVRTVIEADATGKMFERPIDDKRSDAEADLARFHPGGFREIDAKSVVSPVVVLAPETYPGEAGLIQLEKTGAIRPPRREEVEEFIEGISKPYRSKLSPNYRARKDFDYVVTRDIMLPAGLYGAHNKDFLVLPGVPAPRGNVGHGCLAFMDDYRTNDSCLRGMRDSIDQLRQIPSPDRLENCRALSVPPEATLEAVSAYQPEGAKHSHRTRIPVPIDVRVRKPGSVVLVLHTYEPAIWRVSFSAETRIVGIILGGYHTSTVEGVHPDTPIINTEWQGRDNRPKPAPDCAPLLKFISTPFIGGPAAMVLDRQVQGLTGRGLDGLRGAYTLRDVEIR